MSIVECRIVATTPAWIYLVFGSERGHAPPVALENWYVEMQEGVIPRALEGWFITTGGKSVRGGYEYVLRAGPGANIAWVVPGALVKLFTDLSDNNDVHGKKGDSRTKKVDGQEKKNDGATNYAWAVIEPPPNGWQTVADAVASEGEAVLRRLDEPQVRLAAGEDLTRMRGGLEDLIGFPLITDSGGGAGGAAVTRPTGGQAIVDAEIRRVLGRTPKSEDVNNTLALMDRVMRVGVEDGVERWTVARSGVVVQADNGAGVTGRQASLSGLANETLAYIRPLVERVEQLAPRIDNPALLDAARANFLAAASGAVAEAGVPGGPVTPKAVVLLDQSLEQLARFGQELGVLRFVEENPGQGRFVPTRRHVVTPRDEEQFTMFLTVLDRWRVFHDSFRRYLGEGPMADDLFNLDGQAADFGLEFTLLDRTIDVIAEAVDELDAALISVGIDRQEREAMPVGGDGMTVADVMDWAQDFAEREARPLIQSAGIQGAALLPDRLQALANATTQLQAQAADPAAERALRHPRVSVAVDKLLRELGNATRKAQQAGAVTQD